jgi:hypothetical protein
MPGLPIPLGAGATPALEQKAFRFRPADDRSLNGPFGPLTGLDDFNRTSSSSWGSADTGGTWTLTGTASNYNVAPSWGTISTTANGSRDAYLASATVQDTDFYFRFKFDKVPTGTGALSVKALVRRVDSSNSVLAIVRVKPSGNMTVALDKFIGGFTTPGSEVDLGFAPSTSDTYHLRVRANGTSPIALTARCWRDGTAEPNTWHSSISVSDAAVQTSGAFGISTFLSSGITNAPVTLSIGSVQTVNVTGAGTPAQNAGATIDANTTFRLRTELQETGGAAVTDGFHLYYSKNSGAYTRVTTATDIRSVTSTRFADADVTTDILTAGTGTFAVGQGDQDAATGTLTVGASGHTELEWALRIVTAANSDTFDLRVYRDDGTPLDTYTVTPRVTAAVAGGTTYNKAGTLATGTRATASDIFEATETAAAVTTTRAVGGDTAEHVEAGTITTTTVAMATDTLEAIETGAVTADTTATGASERVTPPQIGVTPSTLTFDWALN